MTPHDFKAVVLFRYCTSTFQGIYMLTGIYSLLLISMKEKHHEISKNINYETSKLDVK